MSEDKNVSISRLELARLLHQNVVKSVLNGAKKLQQLQGNLRSVDVIFNEEELKKINKVSQLASEYPEDVIEAITGERIAGKGFRSI